VNTFLKIFEIQIRPLSDVVNQNHSYNNFGKKVFERSLLDSK
jgi:hypothetical protein